MDAPPPAATRLVGPLEALALPPPGGPAVLGVVERSYSNARAQEVALSTRGRTPGQNRIDIAVLGTGRPKGDDVLLTPAFTNEAIDHEMRAALPGVAMNVSPFFASNVYGPYGYALGHGAGGDVCLYGWQRIESAPRPFARNRVISARMRICEPGATETSLLANMQGYTINMPMPPSFRAARPSGTAAPGGGLRHVETVLAVVAPEPRPAPRRRSAPPAEAPAVARATPPAAAAPALPPYLAPPLAEPGGVPAPAVEAPLVPPPPIEAAPLPPAPQTAPPSIPVPAPPAIPGAPMVQATPPAIPAFVPPPLPAAITSAAILSEIDE